MKVGLIVPGFSSDADDWCIPVLVDVVRELTRRAEVHVFALRYPYRRDRYRVHGGDVHALGGGDVRGLRRLQLLTAVWPRIVAEHRRGAFTVLHGLWADEPGFTAVVIARALRLPSVVSVMGGELVAMRDIEYGGGLSMANRLMASHSLRAADCVTAGSSQLVELASRVQRSSRRRVGAQRLVWGVDSCLFPDVGPARDLEGERRLLHVASLVPVKDQGMLLRAMARIHAAYRGVHLHIVGDGPLRPRLAGQAERLGLRDSVTFHGHVDRGDLAAYYRAADLVVVSSRHEAQSAVVLEAALCGTPVVGTAVGLVADLAPVVARAVPVGDERTLADAICDALQSNAGEASKIPAPLPTDCESSAAQTAERLLSMYASLSATKKAG